MAALALTTLGARRGDHFREDLKVKDEAHAKATKWEEVVQPETKLAMGLRIMAGGDPLDLSLIYAVSKSYVYKCVWEVVDTINKRLPFPTDGHQQAEDIGGGALRSNASQKIQRVS